MKKYGISAKYSLWKMLTFRVTLTFVLTALDKTNKKKTIKGKYSYDEKKQTLTMRWGKGGFIRRKIPLNGGKLCLTIQIGNKTLVMNFIQK